MFNSLDIDGCDDYDSITFGDNGKGKVKGLGKIAIAICLSISNVLLVESLNFNLLSFLNFVIWGSSAYLELKM